MKIIDIQTLNQRDSRWKGQRLGTCNGISIGSDGCVVTSACMLLSWYGISILPNELDNKLTDGNQYADGCQFVNGNLPRLYQNIKWIQNINCKNSPAPIKDIQKSIDDGYPVFIWVVNEGVEHCTLGVGYDGNQIIVNDPWRGDRVNVKDRWGDSSEKIIYVNYFSGTKINSSQPSTQPTMDTNWQQIKDYAKGKFLVNEAKDVIKYIEDLDAYRKAESKAKDEKQAQIVILEKDNSDLSEKFDIERDNHKHELEDKDKACDLKIKEIKAIEPRVETQVITMPYQAKANIIKSLIELLIWADKKWGNMLPVSGDVRK